MTDPLPKARTRKLIKRELESEIIFYDLESLEAGCLSPIAAEVFNLCDGKHTPAQIGERIGHEQISEQGVHYVLEKLGKAKLLETGYRVPQSAFEGTSRRAVLAALALGSAPLVAGIPVPAAAQAATCIGLCGDCVPGPNNGGCCPGFNCNASGTFKKCEPIGQPGFCNGGGG